MDGLSEPVRLVHGLINDGIPDSRVVSENPVLTREATPGVGAVRWGGGDAGRGLRRVHICSKPVEGN